MIIALLSPFSLPWNRATTHISVKHIPDCREISSKSTDGDFEMHKTEEPCLIKLTYSWYVMFGAGVLTFVDGGHDGRGGGSHEGLFETNQLMRRECSQGAVQRAQAAAAKARALAMWRWLHHPQCPGTRIILPPSPSWFDLLNMLFKWFIVLLYPAFLTSVTETRVSFFFTVLFDFSFM